MAPPTFLFLSKKQMGRPGMRYKASLLGKVMLLAFLFSALLLLTLLTTSRSNSIRINVYILNEFISGRWNSTFVATKVKIGSSDSTFYTQDLENPTMPLELGGVEHNLEDSDFVSKLIRGRGGAESGENTANVIGLQIGSDGEQVPPQIPVQKVQTHMQSSDLKEIPSISQDSPIKGSFSILSGREVKMWPSDKE